MAIRYHDYVHEFAMNVAFDDIRGHGFHARCAMIVKAVTQTRDSPAALRAPPLYLTQAVRTISQYTSNQNINRSPTTLRETLHLSGIQTCIMRLTYQYLLTFEQIIPAPDWSRIPYPPLENQFIHCIMEGKEAL